MVRGRARSAAKPDPWLAARQTGFDAVRQHDLFGPPLQRLHPVALGSSGVRATALKRGGLLAADAHGGMVYDGDAKVEAAEWVWSLTHVLTHLGFGHADRAHRDGRGSYTPEWRAACCLVVDRFLRTLGIPGTPRAIPGHDDDEEGLALRFSLEGIPPRLAAAGPAGGGPDLWEDLFGNRATRSTPAVSPLGRAFSLGLEAEHRTRQRAQPWDVSLDAWFDQRFPALEFRPRLALPAGPTITPPDPMAEPSRLPEAVLTTRTFAVVLDASGSVDSRLLGRALGSIASSALARDVDRARVVVCDAAVHDAGWLAPDQIADRVTVRGRGGPVLQSGVDLLLTDPAFPAGGPILFITDGRGDRVRVHRDHAWVTPGPLPFTPRGQVFQLS